MAATRDDLAGAIPSPRSALIGRGAVVEQLAERCAAGPRLLTITGPGGAGKTRVAIATAGAAASRLESGARFVPLAGLNDPAALPEAIAGTLGLARAADRPAAEALAAGIGDRELLLVLDNFEHLLVGAPLVSDLLSACPRLRVLATSRRRLDVPDEIVVALDPLDVPDPEGEVEQLDELAGVASVQLFVERASAADPTFALTSENAADVALTCRLLGGSPLAIELAAARMGLLSVRQLAERLAADPLTVLGRGPSELPDRQRSLTATIEWSIDLLDDDERAILRRLSVFEHSFTMDSAEHVADCGPATLDALAVLVESHLVEVLDGEGTPRFAMPVPVRDVARSHLDASGERDEVQARLVQLVVDLGEAAGRGLETAEERRWLDEVDAELDQLRAVLSHLAAADPAAQLRLASALGPFWLHRGFLGEGRRQLARALDPDAAADLSADLVASAAAWEARLAADQGVVGDDEGAQAMLDRLEAGLAAARAAGDVHAELRCIDFLSHVLVLHGDVDRAVAITDEGIGLARAHEHPWFLAQLLQRSAVFARLRDDLPTAADLAVEAWALARLLDADRLVLHAGLTVAQLPPDDRITDPPDLPWLAELATSLGDQRLRCVVVLSIGIEEMLAGRFAEATGHFATAVGAAQDAGYWHGTGFALMCCAALASVTGDHTNCAVLHGAASPTLPVLQRGMPPAYWRIYEDLIDTSRAGLGDERFGALADDGASLGWSLATAGALSFLDGVASGPGTTGATDASSASPAAVLDTTSDPGPSAASPLTTRELEVLERLAAGDTNKDIARRLTISPKTVMHHTLSIYRKLGARGRAEAASIGLRSGLISPTGSGATGRLDVSASGTRGATP